MQDHFSCANKDKTIITKFTPMSKKSISGIATLFAAAACATTMFVACGNKKTASNNVDADATLFATDSISFTDSIVTPGGNKAVCRITADYPTEGNEKLLDSVRTWIAASLATNSYVSSDADPTPYAVSKSLNSNGKKLLDAVTKKVLESAKTDLLQYDSLQIEPAMAMTYEYFWNITKLYQTDKYVTFGNATYAYIGGAHGAAGYYTQVFALEDGAEFGWNMFRPDALEKLRPMVENGIMTQFFKSSTPQEFEESLLLNPDTKEFPLPSAPPYFMADGVHFDYQQYEIAPYSSGMPSCVLPYATVQPLLTPQAAALLK